MRSSERNSFKAEPVSIYRTITSEVGFEELLA